MVFAAEVFAKVGKPKHTQVHNDGRAKREKGGMNEKEPDAEGRNAQSVGKFGTNSEKAQFKNLLYFSHNCNLSKNIPYNRQF